MSSPAPATHPFPITAPAMRVEPGPTTASRATTAAGCTALTSSRPGCAAADPRDGGSPHRVVADRDHEPVDTQRVEIAGVDHRMTRHRLGVRQRRIEHRDDLVLAGGLEHVDRLAALVGAAHHDDTAHDSPPGSPEPVKRAIVASPGCDTPAPVSTCTTVRLRMWRSSRIDRCST